MEEAETGEIEGVPLRVFRADYLAGIALSVGRPKDFTRSLALRESGAVTNQEIRALADRFDLSSKWEEFLKRFDEE